MRSIKEKISTTEEFILVLKKIGTLLALQGHKRKSQGCVGDIRTERKLERVTLLWFHWKGAEEAGYTNLLQIGQCD